MPEAIQASQKNLEKVFCNDYHFEIPVFQRPYAWTTEEADELLDDLISSMNRDAQEPYFLGGIVLIKEDRQNRPDSKVVDGQQRLTTLTMLLCVLRELAEDDVKSFIDGHIRQQANPLTGAKERLRLTLRSKDHHFFRRYVQTEGGIRCLIEKPPKTETDSQVRISENINLFHRKLSALNPESRKQLASFIISQCYLVVVSTPTETSAYRIFSVLNDRGLDLTATDILKAQILGGIADEEQDEYGQKWEDIEQELGRSRFNELFTHIRMIYVKAKQRRTLQEEFKENVLRQHTAHEFIDEILDQYDDVYKRVLGLSDDGQSFGNHLEFLHLLDNADWVPPAMSFFFRHAHAPNLLSKFTKDLERLAYGLFIIRANINQRISRYGRVLADIEQGHDVCRDEGPLQLTVDEKTEIRKKLDGPIYTLPRVPQPLLLRLDSLLAEAGAVYQHPIISVEHVLPQNPRESSQWLTWFPDAVERSRWTHRLANLVLLSSRKNTRASNYEFDRKKEEYFQRGGVQTFALTSQVIGQVEWTPTVLENRQRELLTKLEEEWRLV